MITVNDVNWNLLAESTKGIITMSWLMLILCAAIPALVVLLEWEGFRFLILSFTRDKEMRYARQEACLGRIQWGWDKFHGKVDEFLAQGAALWCNFLAVANWVLDFVLTLIAIPFVLNHMFWLWMEERKRKAEQIAEDARLAQEALDALAKDEDDEADEQFALLQRMVRWLLAAHRAELVKDIAYNTQTSVVHVYKESGTLEELDANLEKEALEPPVSRSAVSMEEGLEPPAWKDLGRNAAVGLAMQAMSEQLHSEVVKAHMEEESISAPSTGRGQTKEILLEDLRQAWLEHGVPEQYAVN